MISSCCSNICVLWVKYRKKAIRSLKVAYNNAFRILLNLSRWCSASGIFVTGSVKSYPEIYRKSVFSFIQRISGSSNFIVTVYQLVILWILLVLSSPGDRTLCSRVWRICMNGEAFGFVEGGFKVMRLLQISSMLRVSTVKCLRRRYWNTGDVKDKP